MTDDNERLSRRRYVQVLSGAGVASLAGCTGGGGDTTTSSSSSSGTTSTSSSGGSSDSGATLEILHGWCGGDGAAAIDALVQGFKEAYPDVTNIDPSGVCGGGNSNLNAAVSKRVQNQNYPSTWSDWPGKNLTQFTDADILQPIGDDVWAQNGMKDAYRQLPENAAKPAGNYVAVPLNVHRINNLFYNKQVMSDAGVDPESLSSVDDLVSASQKITDNTDAVPFAHGSKAPWTSLDLFETTLLSLHGQSGYESFTSGDLGVDEVKMVLSKMADLKEFYPGDTATISWTEANQKVMTGNAGYIVQGDWAAGAYRGNENFNYGDDWGHVPFPGTSDYYALNMDSFVKPRDNPSPSKTNKFLQYCGTKDAQARFNKNKGSIPPRRDVDLSAFPKFQQDQNADFEAAKGQIPSITHGLAVAPQTLTKLSQAMSNFVGSYDADSAANAMVNAVQ